MSKGRSIAQSHATADHCLVQAAALAVHNAMATSSPGIMAGMVARRLHRLIPGATAAVFLRDGQGVLELAATAGPQARAARRLWRSHGACRPGTRLHLDLTPLPGLPRQALVPLRARRTAVGALAVASDSPLDHRSVALARRFASQIAAPIERYLLAAELTAAALAAQQPADLDGTLRAILAGVRRVVPADGAGVLLREGDCARVIAVDGHPEEAIGHLLSIYRDISLEGPLLRGQPIRLQDLDALNGPNPAPGSQHIHGYLGAPLFAAGQVIGILCIDSWRADAFDDEDLRRAGHFATHVGAVLARAHAHALAQAEAVALREAARLATHDPSAPDIIPRILDGVRRVIACDGASVLLREGATAVIAAVHGHPASVLNHRFTITAHSPLERLLIDGLPYLTADLGAEPSYSPAPGAIAIRGHLAVPLMAHGEILGMLAVDSLRYAAFGSDDVARVELFAGYVAAALLNARLHNEAREAAQRDPVTRLFNHRAIHNHLDRELERARAAGAPLAVAMLDLDGFKLYNDTHGHPAGDAALQVVAAALRGACRDADTVGRYGGDEFLVVVPGLGPAEAATLATRLRDAVAARTLRLGRNQVLPLRVSVGVATSPLDGSDRDMLVACADARLYESKQRGEIVAPGLETHEAPGLPSDAFTILDSLITAIDRKDRYTRAHSEEVTRLALLLAAQLDLSPETQRAVRLAGLLHDVGKIGVPDRILKKPGRLTPEEIEIMNGHPALGEAIVAGLPDLAEIRGGVRSHHERWDGRGYPDGLAGEATPLLGRLLAAPDCYSAMTSDRPYRAALSPRQALAEIARGAGTQFDPAIAAAFLRMMERTSSGTRALANDAPLANSA